MHKSIYAGSIIVIFNLIDHKIPVMTSAVIWRTLIVHMPIWLLYGIYLVWYKPCHVVWCKPRHVVWYKPCYVVFRIAFCRSAFIAMRLSFSPIQDGVVCLLRLVHLPAPWFLARCCLHVVLLLLLTWPPWSPPRRRLMDSPLPVGVSPVVVDHPRLPPLCSPRPRIPRRISATTAIPRSPASPSKPQSRPR